MSMPLEPQENENDVIKLIFRMPNGNKLIRRFRFNDKIQV